MDNRNITGAERLKLGFFGLLLSAGMVGLIHYSDLYLKWCGHLLCTYADMCF